ncbi:MAG TPA: MBL fold metallo-hydrolase [Parvularcula sp.]|nr:MBL fold metallo-hydrolase [Parvularcula sp.]HBS32971.1 MBL fold metallo-hydrolase [Parvularcula sp.]
MMAKILTIVLAGAAAVAAAGALVVRLPAVEDRLFDAALEKAMAGPGAAVFKDDGLKVFFCGTGSPLPSARRAQNCTAVIAGDRFFIVDLGSGSFETVQAARLPADRLSAIFLTHFHSDHIGDLSEANLGSWVTARPAPLSVYGPKGVERVVAGENEALALDAGYRTAHHGKGVAPPRSKGMVARPFDHSAPLVVFDDGGLKVTSFPVRHDPVDAAVGYRFEYQGRSVVISGDTAYSESLVAAAKDVDLLIHEAQANHMVAGMRDAAAKAGLATLAKIFSDIPSYHTTPAEAARAANEAGAELLILSHLTPAPDNSVAKRIFMRGVDKIRPGKVMIAEDRLLVTLPRDGGVVFGKL